MRNNRKRVGLLKIGLALLALGTHGSSWAKEGFDRIFIFGDSLSDPGNVYALTGQASKAPYDVIPSAPYVIGGHQFSNGKTWAQRFAQNLRLNKSGKAALDSPVKNGNYAFGGARARSDGFIPSSSVQVNLYLSNNNFTADSDALYVIQFGGNDIRDALLALQSYPADPITPLMIIAEAVESVEDVIKLLHSRGARHFLVANAPDLGLTPALRFSPPPASILGTGLSVNFNEGVSPFLPLIPSFTPGLSKVLDDLEDPVTGLVGITIHRLDIFTFLNTVFSSPGLFGIDEVQFPCLTFGVKSGAKCSNPEDHLFWDGIHPTAVIHKQVADVASEMF